MPTAIHIKKGEVLQIPGALKTKVYFVQSGLLRSYAIDKSGKENVFMFAPEGWVMADTVGPDEPAMLYIDALEDSEILVLAKDLEREKENIAALTKRMSRLQNRILMLISSNAIERYDHFVATYPEIAKRVPQKLIASYLGITPETLSAAKAKRLKKS
ncbi:MAG: Crp/Fnr family transcriptional regulator [Salibacteraceae bacterium]